MTTTVLLARPHPFIVSDMKPLLAQAGFSVSRPEAVADIAPLARQSTAAVISLAVTSPLNASAEEVFRLVREASPKTRLVFASLLPFERTVESIKHLAKAEGVNLQVVGLNASAQEEALLGKPDTCLYFSKEDLSSPQHRERALKLIARHFG